jgi:starch synthase
MARGSVKTLRAKTGGRKPKALRILMIASEAQPFSKTGGLADVAGALPKALERLGHDVTLITPRYRGVTDGPVVGTVSIEVAAHRFTARLMEVSASAREKSSERQRDEHQGSSRALVLDCPELYDREGIYYNARGDFDDNPVRYALLSAAAIDWATTQPPFDIIHSHDWQGGLAPIYARILVLPHPRTPAPAHPRTLAPPHPRTVFTIHNLAYQGVFDKSWVPRLGLTWDGFTINGFEFFDKLSFMKAGINLSDAITTVSPTYAQEIQRPEYGSGLDGVIRRRSDALVGILNGIDPDEWNPAADPHLPAAFDADDLSGKQTVKRALLETFGFAVTGDVLARPVIGMVSRMVDQKGLDLIASVAGELAALDATFTIVGTGEPRYQEMWRTLSRAYPDRISAFIGFDERRAHLVEGGSDIFMMPSRFEPCGLNQMYSQRYGTVPVARAVGGLVDSVRPFSRRNGQGTGFLFAEYQPRAFLDTLRAALAAYPNKTIWTRLQRNGMRVDFSWDRSAGEYVKMYERLRPQGPPGPQPVRRSAKREGGKTQITQGPKKAQGKRNRSGPPASKL